MTVTLDQHRHAARRRQSWTFRARAALWRHPELPLAVLIAGAWVTLAVDHWANHSAVAAANDFGPWSWTLMVVAMMVPGVLPMGRYVAFNSLWSRRHRALWLFVGSYALVWVAVAIAARAVIFGIERGIGWTFAPGARTLLAVGVLAVTWQFTPIKHRALRRCHLREPVGGRGWNGDRRALRYGLVHGWACVGSCWAIMAMMFVAQHDFHLMVPLAAVTIVERFQRRPRGAPGAAAIALAVVLTLVSF